MQTWSLIYPESINLLRLYYLLTLLEGYMPQSVAYIIVLTTPHEFIII